MYVYDPPAESLRDTRLSSPINPNNNRPYGISHIEFCYDFEVDVSKTAETSFTRTFEWTIDKTVSPDSWDLFTGDSGTSTYTVAVTKDTGTDSDWAVSGQIVVENNTPFDATVTHVSDVITGNIAPPVDCPSSLPVVLGPGDSLTCAYSADLPDGTERTNTATVQTAGLVGGGDATAPVTFGDPTTVLNDEINVDDTNGGTWMFSDSGSVMYERTFDCDDEGENLNTATIRETDQSDDAKVTVRCYELVVTKDASTSFDRTWEWTIEKRADRTELTLSPGQTFFVNYTVTVDATSTDSDWAVSGEIDISNPAPIDATLTAVTDLVSPDIAASVDCPSVTVPAEGTLTCTYSADLPDATSRTNTATATLQNYDYAADGTATAAGTTDYSGNASVVFGDTPAAETDECIDVNDTFDGFLGRVCADQLPKVFEYQRQVGPYSDPDDCGQNLVENTATFTTIDTGTMGDDSWTVTVIVPCDTGCTLTPGYWKTHSEYGPAPYDDTWELLSGDGADTLFFGTGQTYYEILHTPPQGGNAYLILAHAYIAAEMNVLNGASIPPDVLDAWTEAGDLLVQYEADVDIPKRARTDRARAIELATILDDYNNGITGPGHCSE